jgi:lipopolysaccharide transport system permease protein
MTEDPAVTIYTPESPIRRPASFIREMAADLLASRELARRLFLRDLRAQYRHSLFGYLWMIVPPLMVSAPFIYLNSSGVMRMGETPIPYPAFAVVGTVIWQTFVDALNSPLRVMNASRAMLTRISFPREAILLSGLMQVACSFLVRLVLLAGVFAAFSLPVPSTAPLFLVGMVSVALTGLAIGVFLTPLGLLYGDVQQALPLASTLLMFLTPVLYPEPVSGVGATIAAINPLTPLVTTTREWLTMGAAGHVGSFVAVSAATVAFLALSWIAYRLALPHLIARLGN